MADLFGFDAYSPKEITNNALTVGVGKAKLSAGTTILLGIMGGAFIGLGALFYTIIVSDSHLTFGISRLLGGLTFSLGLILVVVAGAELFTGNNLLIMAWADRKITTRELLRNWSLVFVTNLLGAGGLALLVYFSGHPNMNQGGIALQYVKMAVAKTSMPFTEALIKGILCNILVCLAVWLALAGRSVTDKVVAIVFPISAFVAAGFEHCVANMYFIPIGILLKDNVPVSSGLDLASLNWPGFFESLVPVTLGNILGGSVLVGLVYFFVYRVTIRQK